MAAVTEIPHKFNEIPKIPSINSTYWIVACYFSLKSDLDVWVNINDIMTCIEGRIHWSLAWKVHHSIRNFLLSKPRSWETGSNASELSRTLPAVPGTSQAF